METPKEARERITADAVARYDKLCPTAKALSEYALNESKLDAEYILNG